MPTLFEKIIAGELPATVLYRDARVIAFADIRPAAPVHILVVPHKPIPTTDDIEDADESLIGHMVIVARDIRARPRPESSGRALATCNRCPVVALSVTPSSPSAITRSPCGSCPEAGIARLTAKSILDRQKKGRSPWGPARKV